MINITRLLCPVDFSGFSRHAVDHALAIAHWYNAQITALHVLPLVPYTDPLVAQPFVYTPEDIEQVRLSAARFVAEEAGDTAIETVVRQGYVSDQITAEASAVHADLIVMGTHGRTGFDRLVLGSVTERVLRKAPCPVLTVPRKAPDAVPARALFTRILCAVDFSPPSLKALDYAISLAAKTNARLAAVYVTEPGAMLEPVAIGAISQSDRQQFAATAARQQLRETIAGRQSPDVTQIVTIGKPYREILRIADEQHCDLIVMGAHSEPLGVLAFGSTTNHVVRQAACPVLTLMV